MGVEAEEEEDVDEEKDALVEGAAAAVCVSEDALVEEEVCVSDEAAVEEDE